MRVCFCLGAVFASSLLFVGCGGSDGGKGPNLSNQTTLSLLAGPLGGPGWADGTG
jgi:hypothetical protein